MKRIKLFYLRNERNLDFIFKRDMEETGKGFLNNMVSFVLNFENVRWVFEIKIRNDFLFTGFVFVIV